MQNNQFINLNEGVPSSPLHNILSILRQTYFRPIFCPSRIGLIDNNIMDLKLNICLQAERTLIMFPKVTVVDPSFLFMILCQLDTLQGLPPLSHSTSTLDLRLTSFLQVGSWIFLWLEVNTSREVGSQWKYVSLGQLLEEIIRKVQHPDTRSGQQPRWSTSNDQSLR